MMLVDLIIQGAVPKELQENMTIELDAPPLKGEHVCIGAYVFEVVTRWHDADLSLTQFRSTLVCTVKVVGERPLNKEKDT